MIFTIIQACRSVTELARRAITLSIFVLLLTCLTGELSAQTTLQRCLGLSPGQEPHGKIGPSPATIGYCRQLPAWNLYEEAGQQYQTGAHASAMRLALQAAEAGNPEAQLRVAKAYVKGDGVASSSAQAFRWFKAAAAAGEPMAQDLLGTIFEYGRSTAFYAVDDNWDMAARLWQASASQGYVGAEFSLGRAYQYGIGVPADRERAIDWYDKAAAQGNSQAEYFAKYLRDNHGLDGTTRDGVEQAIMGPMVDLSGGRQPIMFPTGITFHHLSERLAFLRQAHNIQQQAKSDARARMYSMQQRAYQTCLQEGRVNCVPPPVPPK